MHPANSFLTLTYNDNNLPDDRSVNIKELQTFMKALRKKISPTKIRFFSCGEYGEKLGRPHYHLAIFGYDFPDKILFSQREGNKLYTSPLLDSVWKKGYSIIGELNYQSAAYIARYIVKKITGEAAETHYEKIDEQTGEVFKLKPEFINMSRKPGIGKDWFDTYQSDVFPSDFVVIQGKEHKVPKYYDTQFEMVSPLQFAEIKKERTKRAFEDEANQTPARLKVREKTAQLKLRKLKRSLEDS